MKKIMFLTTALLFVGSLCAQNDTLQKQNMHYVKDYPQGLYLSYEDFLAKKTTPLILMERRTIFGEKRIHRDSISNNNFFFTIAEESYKYSEAFAISFNNQLYIKQRELSKKAKKGEKTQEGNNPNSYHRVIKDGKFFYMEGRFANGIAKGAAYGIGGAVGGVIAGNLNRLKGVIFDFEAQHFDFFKQCEDFKNFLKERKIVEFIYCDKYDITVVRSIIDKNIQ